MTGEEREMADTHERETGDARQAAADAAYEAARFDGLCEEGAREVAIDALRALESREVAENQPPAGEA
jgi:hypothetical protein